MYTEITTNQQFVTDSKLSTKLLCERLKRKVYAIRCRPASRRMHNLNIFECSENEAFQICY